MKLTNGWLLFMNFKPHSSLYNQISNKQNKYKKLGAGRTVTCPCATRRTSIYKGLATLPYKCSRNCQ